VPQGFCLDERDLPSGTYLLVYSVLDSWLPVPGMEQARFCGAPLPEWLTKRRLTAQDILESRAPGSTEGRRFDLHEARLFVAGAGVDFVEGYIHPPADPAAWAAEFRAGTRLSLREINDEDSVEQREARRRHVRAQLLRNTILSGRGWTSVCERDFRDTFRRQDVDALRKLSESSGDSLRRFYRMRNLRSLLRGGPDADSVEELHIDYRGRTDSPALFRRAVRQEQTVRASAPVRMDLAGGWTDTPPYTLREGGEVVNVAVDLDGRPPIQVTCRSTAEKLIVLRSVDTDAREIVRGFRQLEDYRSLQSPFSLPKAALCLLGMTREGTRSGSLAEALDRIGCGIELSMLSGVPQGSGLGTSSILGATVIAALERFSGIALDIQEVSRKVLRMEQMLTTGGGWQDQLGGICGGVKYLSSAPGIAPNPIIHQLDPFILEDEGHARRLTLYYTGITRLAKNILQEVVERVAGAEPAYLFTLRSLKVLARRARDSFALRDLNRLAGVVQESWEANKRIHLSTTNDEVDALLAATQGLSAGMKLLGAGGGGFALFISRTPRDASALREALAARSGTAARLTRMSLNKDGLRVEVS
jgi:galactokinase/mevalonate kinase-like predicted kinase